MYITRQNIGAKFYYEHLSSNKPANISLYEWAENWHMNQNLPNKNPLQNNQ